jgi:hypothetical protein
VKSSEASGMGIQNGAVTVDDVAELEHHESHAE